MRKISFLPLFIWVFSLLYGGVTSATNYTVTEESDWYFTLEETTLVTIYGNSNANCETVMADPYLWLYDDSDTLIVADDDGNHNSNDQCVSSKIYTTLDAGDYKLRAGYCCTQLGLGNTPEWGNGEYELITEFGLSSTSTTTTTTTVPQSIGPPMNLTGEVTEDGVYLDWDAPNTGNVEPERYAISFRIPPGGGWGVATGNVGDETALNTEYTLPFSIFENTGGLDSTYVFDVRSDNDTLSLYSGWSTQVELLVSVPTPPPTTTTTTIWETSTTSTTTTTTSVPVPVVQPVPSSTTTTTVATTTTTVPPTTTTTSSTTTVPPTTSSTTSTTSSTSTTTTTTTTLPPPPPSTTSTTTTTTAPQTTTSTTTSTSTTSTTVPSTTTTSSTSTTTTTEPPKPAPAPAVAAIITRIQNEELAESMGELLSDEDEITVEVLHQVIDNEDFDSLDEGTLEAVSAAISEAPDEVKEEFESEVNVFEGSFDTYVPTGSKIDVGTRRTVVAVTASMSAVAAAPAGGGRRRR